MIYLNSSPFFSSSATFTSNSTLRGTIVDIVRDIIIDSLYSNTARVPTVIDYFLSVCKILRFFD
jgi:hypothetical protein